MDTTPTTTDIISSITWGPSPIEPINLVSVAYDDDDIIAWEGSFDEAADIARLAGLTYEDATPDGLTRWTR